MGYSVVNISATLRKDDMMIGQSAVEVEDLGCAFSCPRGDVPRQEDNPQGLALRLVSPLLKAIMLSQPLNPLVVVRPQRIEKKEK